MYDNMNMQGWDFTAMHLLMWGFWVLIIMLIVWVVIRLIWAPGNGPKGQPTAVEILDARYAKGEMDHAEYQHKRREIKMGDH